MAERRRARSDEERKKMFVKVGGGGGGIGAVVVLGGVLATAVLASTFIVGKKGGRTSGKESRRRQQDAPPEIKKESEMEEGANNGQHSDVDKQPSVEAKKEIEADNNLGTFVSSESFKIDEKPDVEVRDDAPKNELKKPENDAVSNVSGIKDESFPLDENSSAEPKTTLQKKEEAGAEIKPRNDGGNERTKMNYKEAVERTIKATKVDSAVEGVRIDQKEEEGQEIEGVSCNNGVTSEEKHSEVIEQPDSKSCIEGGQKTHLPVSASDHAVDQENVNEEEIVSESHSKNGQQGDLSVADNPVMEHENVKGNEMIPEKSHRENGQKAELPISDNPVMEHENEERTEMTPEETHSESGQDDLLPVSDSPVMEDNNSAEIVEIVEENEEASKRRGQNEAKYEEEMRVKEEKEWKCDQTDEATVFIPVKCDDEPNHSNLPHDESGQENGNHLKKDETEDSSEITKQVGALFHKFDDSIATAKVAMMMESSEDDEATTESLKDSNDESDSSDGAEKSTDSSLESNSDAVWPAEKIIESQLGEMTGKTKEDVVSIKKPEKSNEKDYITLADTEKTFIKHLMGMTMLREIATNVTRRRMIVGTGFALSTLSCSWFFGLTVLKLCLIVFMTMALSKINAY